MFATLAIILGMINKVSFTFAQKEKKNIYKCSNCVIENEYVETTIKKEIEKTKNNILIFNYLKMKIRNHCCKNIIG